jgi:hypothetical protein
MILTKSVHRSARNTVDVLRPVRMLTSRNIDTYFEQEGILIYAVIDLCQSTRGEFIQK